MQQINDAGLYTRLPNVLLDSCQISDEALTFFIKLYRQVGYKNGVFYGSVRKIAALLDMKRDKVHRNIKTLETSGLANAGIAIDMEISAIELHLEELWELNKYAEKSSIPPWSNLQFALNSVRQIEQNRLESVRNIGQETDKNDGKSSDKSDDAVRNIGQVDAKTGQSVRNIGRSVRPFELKVGTTTLTTLTNKLTTNTNYTEEEKKKPRRPAKSKEVTPPEKEKQPATPGKRKRVKTPVEVTPPQQQTLPEPLLTDAEQTFFDDIYCKASRIKAIPSLTPSLAGHIKKILAASVIHDVDDMDSFYTFVRSLGYLKDRAVYPGDLSNANNLNSWHEYKTRQEKKSAPISDAPDAAEPELPIKRIDETMLVWWSRTLYTGSCLDGDNWKLMERMPIYEARQCPKPWSTSYTHRYHVISELYQRNNIPVEVWHPIVKAESGLYTEHDDYQFIYYRPAEVAAVA